MQHRRGAIHATKRVARSLILAWASCLFFSFSAQAQVVAPAQAEPAQLRVLGTAKLTFWGFDVYNATLRAEPGFKPAELMQSNFALELKYLRAFTGRDIAKRSIDEMRRIADFSEEQAQRWLNLMQAAFPDVKPGDSITGINRPGQGARIMFNGQVITDFPDTEFSRLFFGIWLSEKTSEPKMRRILLGL